MSLRDRVEALESAALDREGVVVLWAEDGRADAVADAWEADHPEATPSLLIVLRWLSGDMPENKGGEPCVC